MKQGEKLSDAKVKWLKERLCEGWSTLALARMEGLSEQTVWRIKTGRTYNHVGAAVVGEDVLLGRAPITFGEGKGVKAPEVRGGASDEEIEESLKRMMAKLGM
jgi:hypothetical protein